LRRRPHGLELFSDIDCPIALLDPPARNRIEGRRAQRLAGAQAEAGVVPRAADGTGDECPLGEWTVVMGAFRPDREQRPAAARQQNRFARDVPQDHAALGEVSNGDPLGKVGSSEFCILFAQDCLLLCEKTPPGNQTSAKALSAI
jgi:hypothetical protein